MQWWMAQICGLLACLFVGALGLIIIIWIATDRIKLEYLISEANGQASMSRFQLLLFTFVVAISLFKLVEMHGQLPDIPNGILTLLGISASTYAVGKGITYSRDPREAKATPPPPPPGDHPEHPAK